MAVKHQLRFLGYLPHPHWSIPSSCGHAALAAQAVQARDGVLMTKPTAKSNVTVEVQLALLKAGRNYGMISRSQSFHICILVYVPHFNRTVMRGAVEVMSSPSEWKTLRRKINVRQWTLLRDTQKPIHAAEWLGGGAHRHRAFVSCEFIEMFACFCFPDHYQLVHITSGLQKQTCWLMSQHEGACLQAEAGLLTKYLASDEIAIHRMWAVCPTCRSSVPFLPPGIVCSFFPLSISPEYI